MNERLEDIINDLPYSIRHEGNVEALIDYAKEQDERVEELERELERIKVKYRVTKESHYNCSKSTSELEQQNERYRELLTSKIMKDLIRLESKGCFFADEKRTDFINFKLAVEKLGSESE